MAGFIVHRLSDQCSNNIGSKMRIVAKFSFPIFLNYNSHLYTIYIMKKTRKKDYNATLISLNYLYILNDLLIYFFVFFIFIYILQS